MSRTLLQAIEIEASPDEVFAQWARLEDFPHLLGCVRRVKRIDEGRSLWDVDIAGRQVMWEARIVDEVPGKLLRWESCWGVSHAGWVRFEPLPDGRTELRVEIEYSPRSLVERLGARLGLVDFHVRSDLDRFRRFVEDVPDHARLS